MGNQHDNRTESVGFQPGAHGLQRTRAGGLFVRGVVLAGAGVVMRTYDWNGNVDMPIMAPHLSDIEVACRVRMLMRHDLTHESTCELARDRIMALVKEKAELVAALEDCRGALSLAPENAVSYILDAIDAALAKAEQP